MGDQDGREKAALLLREKRKLEMQLEQMRALQRQLEQLEGSQQDGEDEDYEDDDYEDEEGEEGEDVQANEDVSQQELEEVQSPSGRANEEKMLQTLLAFQGISKEIGQGMGNMSEEELARNMQALSFLENMLDEIAPGLKPTSPKPPQPPRKEEHPKQESQPPKQANSTEENDAALMELLSLVGLLQKQDPQAPRQLLRESGFDDDNIELILQAAQSGRSPFDIVQQGTREHQQQSQRPRVPESPRVVELPSDDEVAAQLEEQVQAAQAMLEEVHELRNAIEELRQSPDQDDPEIQKKQSETLSKLLVKLDELERRKSSLSQTLSSEKAIQGQRREMLALQQRTPRLFLSHTAHLEKEQQSSKKQSLQDQEDEVRQVMLALEQARELGREKSLQLKRHEQEVATLQRNIKKLEDRLCTIKPGAAIDTSSQHGTISSEYVEAGSSIKSFDDLPRIQSPGSRDSRQDEIDEIEEEDLDEQDQGEEDGAKDHASINGVAQSLDGCTDVDTPLRVDDEDDEEDEEDIGPIRSVSATSARALKSVEETSVVARAGSTAGDYPESIDDVNSEPAGRQMSTRKRRVYIERSRREEENLVTAPSTRYLEATDWNLLMEDIHEFLDDYRARQDPQRAVGDRAFGRQMLNFLTKVFSELGHLDIGSPDKQREIVKALRNLSMKP